MTVRQRHCDALYAAGRVKEAGEALLNIVNFFDEDIYMAEPVVTWLSGELYCLVSPPFIDASQQISCIDVSPPKTVMTQLSLCCH